MARHRRHRSRAWAHWLGVGAVAAGVGGALGGGSAIASAAPSDTSDTGTHAEGAQAGTASRGPAARPGPRKLRREVRAAVADIVSRVNNREDRVRRSVEDAVAPRGPRVDTTNIARTVRINTSVGRPAAPRRLLSPMITRSALTAAAPEPTSPPEAPALPPLRPVARVVPDLPAPQALPAPQTVTSSVISPVWARLGFAGPGTPTPAAPVSDIVASIWVAVRETTGQRFVTTGRTDVTVAAPPSGATTSLGDVTGRPGVTATVNEAGAVRAISGTFTDTKVEDADGAAQLLNDMSGLIGAPAGFADPDNITVQQVTTASGYSRTIYRAHHSVDGVDVVGSDVILVTDTDGNVTGLFNYYDGRADVVDTTPARRVDTETEAAATALAAYAGTPSSPLYYLAAAPLVAAGVVKPELMIDATDDAAVPQLVWKVSIDPPDTDLTGAYTVNPGST